MSNNRPPYTARHPYYAGPDYTADPEERDDFYGVTHSSVRCYRAQAPVTQDDPSYAVTRTGCRNVQRYQDYDQVNVHVLKKRRQQGLPPTRARVQHTQQDLPVQQPVQQQQRKRRIFLQPHWLLWVGLVMCVMVGGWVLLTMVSGWWLTSQDDTHYGRPRTFQTDAVVGHHDSPGHPSHFIALNLNRHVLIYEIPGGDASRTRVYTGPVLMGDGQDLAPVTVSFQDVNHNGKPEMFVRIQNQEIVFTNDGTQFHPS